MDGHAIAITPHSKQMQFNWYEPSLYIMCIRLHSIHVTELSFCIHYTSPMSLNKNQPFKSMPISVCKGGGLGVGGGVWGRRVGAGGVAMLGTVVTLYGILL